MNPPFIPLKEMAPDFTQAWPISIPYAIWHKAANDDEKTKNSPTHEAL